MSVESELAEIKQELRALKDRADITDCLNNYARGLDRMDKDLALSTYHPDSTDDRGPGRFTGTGPEFVDWAWEQLPMVRSTFHCVSNIVFDIQDDEAHTECHVQYIVWAKDGKTVTIGTARYLDRLERRKGEWRIAHRETAMDYRFTAECTDPAAGVMLGTRDRTDRSYVRPLELTPEARAAFDKRKP